MKIKSYFANTVEDAMAPGPSGAGTGSHAGEQPQGVSRYPPPGGIRGGLCHRHARRRGGTARARRLPGPAGRPAPGDRLSQQIVGLKKELEGMRRTITRSALTRPRGGRRVPTGRDAYMTLTAGEVPPELALEIVQAAEARIGHAAAPRKGSAQRADKKVFRSGAGRGAGIAFHGAAGAGQGGGAAAHRGPGGASRFRQDHHVW